MTERKTFENIRKSILLEMPYEKKDFFIAVDTSAKNAYIHLSKIALYGNITQDSNKWINEIVNKFTIQMLLSKTYVSNKSRANVLIKGYTTNIFGDNFQDYEEMMPIFMSSAISDIEDEAEKRNLPIPTHIPIEEAVKNIKNTVITYANTVASLAFRTTQQEANQKLQNVLRTEIGKIK